MKNERIRTIWERVQTVVLVSIITLLVWLYAEGEATGERARQVEIVLVSEDDDLLLLEPTGPSSITIRVQASGAQLERLDEQLSQGPLEIAVGADFEGDQPREVDLRELLEAGALRGAGVSVLEVSPERLPVHVERSERVSLPVEADVGRALLAGPAQVEPAAVALMVPASLAAYAEQAVALASVVEAESLEVDREHVVEAPVRLPERLDHPAVRVEPEQVQVRLTIREPANQVTLRDVPIQVNVEPALLRSYAIDLDDEAAVLEGVTLSGPAEWVERVRSGEVRVWAELRPSRSELEAGAGRLPVYLQKPAELEVESTLSQIPVHIEQRADSQERNY